VALDWLEDGCPASAPVVIILPGLTGDSQSQYIRCLVLSANRMKLRIVVFNYRGLGGMSLKVILERKTFEENDFVQILIQDNLLGRYPFLSVSICVGV
jgi:predicted alpha/beta-fold hydrolase